MQEEIDSLLAYSTITDEGQIQFLPGNQNIHVHFVFAVKHDLRYKARLVAGGHLTDPNNTASESPVLYPSVVCESLSLLGISTTCSLWLVTFLLHS
jgi:hypothetical protein